MLLGKKLSCRRLLSSACALVLYGSLGGGWAAGAEHIVIVEPGCEATPVPHEIVITPGGGELLIETIEPELGVVEKVAGGWSYSPSDAFWSTGFDSISFLVTDGLSERMTSVFLLAGLLELPQIEDDFEGGWRGEWLVLGARERLRILPEAALSGDFGLRVDGAPAGDDALLWLPDNAHGGGNDGSGAQSDMGLPARGGPRPTEGAAASVMQVGNPGFGAADLELRWQDDSPWVRLATSFGAVSPWIRTTSGVHDLRLLRWGWNGDSLCDAGAGLWLDGGLVATLPFPPSTQRGNAEVRLGHLGAGPSGAQPAIDIDNVRTFKIDRGQSDRALVQVDDFESTELALGWLGLPTSMALSPNAALVGNGGLEVTLGGGAQPAGGLLIHRLADQEADLGARFRVDASGLLLEDGDWIRLFSLHTNSTDRLASIAVQHLDGVTTLEVKARLNDGSTVREHVPFDTSGPVALIVDWHAARAEAGPTGTLRIYIDGNQAVEIVGLDNAEQKASEIRFGAKRLVGTAAGVVLLDHFASWRSNSHGRAGVCRGPQDRGTPG